MTLPSVVRRTQQSADLEVDRETREFLGLLERDTIENPESLIVVTKADREEIECLIGDYQVDLDYELN
ncbi:hypothetical protein BBM20_14115 [Vibrio parahaemolyticus]|nr:hypothetical protein BBM20_14115 [Vibrio parahaemolyticus]